MLCFTGEPWNGTNVIFNAGPWFTLEICTESENGKQTEFRLT
jgi:hypothetical protein